MAAAFNAEQLEQFVQSCTTTLAELRSASRPISATDDGFMHSLMCAWEISECSYDRLHSDARLRLERQHEHVDRLSRQLLQQLAAMQKQLQVLQKVRLSFSIFSPVIFSNNSTLGLRLNHCQAENFDKFSRIFILVLLLLNVG